MATTGRDVSGYKVVGRDYGSPIIQYGSERWTVGARHKLPPSVAVVPGQSGYHFCQTLGGMRQWMRLHMRLSEMGNLRLVRVCAPAGARVACTTVRGQRTS